MDKDRVDALIALGSSARDVQRIQDIAARAMKAARLGYTMHKACAATLSAFLQQAGIDVPMTLGAGKLASRLSGRGWTRIGVGRQRPGDVGVTFDKTSPSGADHVYLVLSAPDADKMTIADNQAPKPHTRYASGRGRTATEYFLRAPENVGRSLHSLASYSPATETIDPANEEFYPWEDEDTNQLPEPFTDEGTPAREPSHAAPIREATAALRDDTDLQQLAERVAAILATRAPKPGGRKATERDTTA